jgi:lipopolysaccharide/colanic/teichoic acid biosynthesis glycosyltransferase
MHTARTHDVSRTERGSLASSTARRQGVQLGWSCAGGVTLALSYAIALCLMQIDWATPQFAQTVLWSTVPYLLCAQWIYRSASLPAAERTSVLLVTTVTPFLLLMLGFALFQYPYSRGAVLLVYVLTFSWFALGDRLHKHKHVQHLVCLDPGIAERLSAWCGEGRLSGYDIELHQLQEKVTDAQNLLIFDGVVLDRRVAASTERSQLLGQLKLNHMRLHSVEAVAELLSGRKMLPREHDELWELDGNPAYDLAKRAVDLLIVLATSPLWLGVCAMVGVAVRFNSAGPALYSQIRVGRNGRPFRLWKFRSMRHLTADAPASFAQANDERITRVGRFIRRWRLDELPQLYNVLLGHMSLIGPRPEQLAFVEAFATRIPAYTYRHLVRPGLTGWAQMQQGYADSEESAAIKLSYDLYYVAHYSMALDLLIFLKTGRILLSGFGAR